MREEATTPTLQVLPSTIWSSGTESISPFPVSEGDWVLVIHELVLSLEVTALYNLNLSTNINVELDRIEQTIRVLFTFLCISLVHRTVTNIQDLLG